MRAGSRWCCALVAAVGTLSGCSLVFQQRLRDNDDGTKDPDCTESKALSIVDRVFVGLAGVSILASMNNDELSESDKNTILLSAVIQGVVHGTSAIAGVTWA